MPLRTWQTVNFFDPMTGEDAIMFLGYSGHGTFWIKESAVPAGKSRRAQRESALDRIEAAIDAGAEPGEVK